MFLITTADKNTWKSDEKILFLGEWCRLYNEENIWGKLDAAVLPYHWDDRAQMLQDYHYLNEVCEKYLNSLTEQLNDLHDVKYSVRYWRITVGRWLRVFIQLFYGRYCSILAAAKSGQVTNTWIYKESEWDWLPQDYKEFEFFFNSEGYNHFLYGRIIKKLEPFTYKLVEKPNGSKIKKSIKSNKFSLNLKNSLKELLNKISKLIPKRFVKCVFPQSGFSLLQVVYLSLSLRQFPYMFSYKQTAVDDEANFKQRQGLSFKLGSNDFEHLLDEILVTQIPRCFIEGYRGLSQQAVQSYPPKVKMIFTANVVTNMVFNLWLADQVEKGAKLLVAQAGGLHGISLWSTTDRYDTEICDNYYTWGWQEKNDKKLIAMPAIKLCRLPQRKKSVKSGDVLWLQFDIPRYSYYMFSVPIASQMLFYLQDQQSFYKALSNEAKASLLIRFSPAMVDSKWQHSLRWRSFAQELRQNEPCDKDYLQSLIESRLVISTTNSTTYLETMSLDIPTIAFWDEKCWEVRDDAWPYLNRLKKVGILHSTPEAAAAKLNQVCADPAAWWRTDEVQEARQLFCKQYARTNPDWLQQWRREVKRQFNQINEGDN
jgi:putative transferase (TIGR04331 family)